MSGASQVTAGTPHHLVLTDDNHPHHHLHRSPHALLRNNAYITNWEVNRAQEIKDLTSKGIIPVEDDFEKMGDDIDDETMDSARPFLMGKAAAVVNEKKSAKAVVDELVGDAVKWLQIGNKMIAKL
ncbi:hypothetical protein VE04_10192 [Pseudogymnoascus sp. 24MN13]|nr:hypothetical protein VE04_10192 [Pseudogymnoascus sp. 24MN13]